MLSGLLPFVILTVDVMVLGFWEEQQDLGTIRRCGEAAPAGLVKVTEKLHSDSDHFYIKAQRPRIAKMKAHAMQRAEPDNNFEVITNLKA